jgi:exodeoxyribonuclease VII large subunit
MYIHSPPNINFNTLHSNYNPSGVHLASFDFHIFTVEEITQYIKSKLISDPKLTDIWISGEISNFVHHTSGHFYFTLKDEHTQLPCAMFRWANEDLKFKLASGLSVIALGSIDVYKPQGRYNFVVSEVHPKGPGELYLQFLQLKEKLTKEGLFDVKFKKPIPRFPSKIGVITSPTGAAIQDILNITARRFSAAELLVVPTLVQGESAASDIVRSIRLLNRYSDVDVIIVGRGGGSIEDLWPFNEEVVARAIFESSIPIISAVGHETDFTISDFVADIRAATPSSAAELAVPDKEEVLRQVSSLNSSLIHNMDVIFKMKKTQLEGIYNVLKPRLLLDRVNSHQQYTDELNFRLVLQMEHNLEICFGRFNALSEMLDAVSPLSTLKRGYSITLKLPKESVVESVDMIKEGNDVKILIKDGEMRCKVTNKEKKMIMELKKDENQ